ncbi:MAG: transposase [Candidatus Thiodiazotropha sp. L084R]
MEITQSFFYSLNASHLHIVVPGGCIHKKCKLWKQLKGQYLFNEFVLASVFRGSCSFCILL